MEIPPSRTMWRDPGMGDPSAGRIFHFVMPRVAESLLRAVLEQTSQPPTDQGVWACYTLGLLLEWASLVGTPDS